MKELPLCTACEYFLAALPGQGVSNYSGCYTADDAICIRLHQLIGKPIYTKCIIERSNEAGRCGAEGSYFKKKEIA